MRSRSVISRLLLSVTASTVVSSCAGLKQRSVTARENDLSAAGFLVKPANTPERQAMLQRLPPNKLVTRTNGDEVHYVYADAVVCNCIYVGSQQAYQQFQQHEQQ